MARSFDGTADYIEVDAAAMGTAAATHAMWVKPLGLPTVGDRKVFFGYHEQANTEPYGNNTHELFFTPSGTIKYRIWDGANKLVSSTTLTTVGTWYHVASTMDSSFITIYINGVQEAQTAAGATPAFTDAALAYCRIPNSLGDAETSRSRGNCLLAEAAGWNAVLSANEIFMLSRGVSPLRINRPASRLFYHPLFGVSSPEPDYFGQAASGVLNVTTQAAHAPVAPMFGIDETSFYVAPSGAPPVTTTARLRGIADRVSLVRKNF